MRLFGLKLFILQKLAKSVAVFVLAMERLNMDHTFQRLLSKLRMVSLIENPL